MVHYIVTRDSQMRHVYAALLVAIDVRWVRTYGGFEGGGDLRGLCHYFSEILFNLFMRS